MENVSGLRQLWPWDFDTNGDVLAKRPNVGPPFVLFRDDVEYKDYYYAVYKGGHYLWCDEGFSTYGTLKKDTYSRKHLNKLAASDIPAEVQRKVVMPTSADITTGKDCKYWRYEASSSPRLVAAPIKKEKRKSTTPFDIGSFAGQHRIPPDDNFDPVLGSVEI